MEFVGQIIKRNEEIFIWSRGEELVIEQFPELMKTSKISGNFVLDGEILAIKEGQVLNFNVTCKTSESKKCF